MVEIHYKRLPDRLDLFRQALVHEGAGYVVTLLDRAGVRRPVTVGERTILEPGAPVVWFTYPGAWHDVGRFHLADGTFTGFYANVLTPVVMRGDRWETTDLCLDVWADAEGPVTLLDAPDLEVAREAGWVDAATSARAEAEAASLLRAAREGSWPPPHVREWTLERARNALPYSTSEADTSRRMST